MLKSCKYCGRIHDSKFDCGEIPIRGRKPNPTPYDRFRGTKKWQDKRNEIKQRDSYTCQLCIRKAHAYTRVYEIDDLSVHHAIALENDYERRLDNDNLITLCQTHHELAEKGEIRYEIIKQIIQEQESFDPPLPKS